MALAIHHFGKGTCAYFPVPIDWAYASQRALPDHRNLIRNVVRYLHPNPEVRVEAPVNVESVVMQGRTDGELIVHLVALWPRENREPYLLGPAATVEPMEEPAGYRAKVTLAAKVRRIHALNPETKVNSLENVVTIETSQIHEAVIVQT